MSEMVNGKSGEFIIEIGGEEHVARYSMRAVRVLQQHFKVKTLPEVFNGADKWAADDYVVLLKAGFDGAVAARLARKEITEAQADEMRVSEEYLLDMMTLDQLQYYLNTVIVGLNLAQSGKGKQEIEDASPAAVEPDPTKPAESLAEPGTGIG